MGSNLLIGWWLFRRFCGHVCFLTYIYTWAWNYQNLYSCLLWAMVKTWRIHNRIQSFYLSCILNHLSDEYNFYALYTCLRLGAMWWWMQVISTLCYHFYYIFIIYQVISTLCYHFCYIFIFLPGHFNIILSFLLYIHFFYQDHFYNFAIFCIPWQQMFFSIHFACSKIHCSWF